MATYKKIQGWVKKNYGFIPKTCWIAHCKELYGLPVKRVPNRFRDDREVPCPESKRRSIYEAFCRKPEVLNLQVSSSGVRLKIL